MRPLTWWKKLASNSASVECRQATTKAKLDPLPELVARVDPGESARLAVEQPAQALRRVCLRLDRDGVELTRAGRRHVQIRCRGGKRGAQPQRSPLDLYRRIGEPRPRRVETVGHHAEQAQVVRSGHRSWLRRAVVVTLVNKPSSDGQCQRLDEPWVKADASG